MGTNLSHDQVLELIPHRPPALLIDSARENVVEGRRARLVASTLPRKHTKFEILEAIGQASVILANQINASSGKIVVLAGMDKITWTDPAAEFNEDPTLEVRVVVEPLRLRGRWGRAKGTVHQGDNRLILSSTLLFSYL